MSSPWSRLSSTAYSFWAALSPVELQALTGQHIAIRDGKVVITDTAA
jgi:hypothetical protein